MKKLSIIYNFSQKYREGIYKLLDKEYDCDWYFGNNNTDIKGIDYSVLHNVHEIKNKKIIGPLYFQSGIVSQFFKYDRFLMLGELFCLSTWILLFLCTFSPKKKIYIWSHGWYGRESKLKKILKRLYFAMADKVFLYGQHAMDVARSFGYKKNNLCVLHNSLDYEKQIKIRYGLQPSDIYKKHFGNNDPVIIFIGRLTAIKQLDMLVDALKAMTTKCNLVFVGDGAKKDDLQALVKKYDLEDRVWFYGACYEEKENAQLIYNADVCVAPGNVGLTAMHAMVYGTPVITHDNFAYQMPEYEAIVKGITGDFFKHLSTDSLADTISNWLAKNKEKREDIRKACYKEIDDHWTPQFQMNVFRRNLDDELPQRK